MISKARQIVKDVMDRYYTQHHDKETFETELTNEINGGRIGGFSEAKRRVVAGLDHRIEKLTEQMNGLAIGQGSDFGTLHKLDAVRDELEKIRLYVKGMVVKVDE